MKSNKLAINNLDRKFISRVFSKFKANNPWKLPIQLLGLLATFFFWAIYCSKVIQREISEINEIAKMLPNLEMVSLHFWMNIYNLDE